MSTALQPERRETTRLSYASRAFEVKGVDAPERTFEGHSAVFNNLDLGGDIIYPGAFAKTLTFWKERGFAIPLIDHHRYGSIHNVLGSVIDAAEDTKGLWSKFEVDDGPEGDKLIRHITHRRLNGLSVGYRPVNPEVDAKGIRHLRELQWRESSPVLWPMNESAGIDANSLKSLNTLELSDEELQEALDALSAEAKARDEKANPAIPQEEADALLDRLSSLRLRPLLSRTSGQKSEHLTPDEGKHNETGRDKGGATGAAHGAQGS